jgi:hypothetical protein
VRYRAAYGSIVVSAECDEHEALRAVFEPTEWAHALGESLIVDRDSKRQAL